MRKPASRGDNPEVAPGHGGHTGTDLDDLDELQIVSRREYRRGYLAQVDGRPMRLTYGKVMTTRSGVLVYRPAAGAERPKRLLWGIPRALGIIALSAWPVTMIAFIVLIALAVIGIRALLS